MPTLVYEPGTRLDPIVPTVTLDRLGEEVRELYDLGVGSVKIFSGGEARDTYASDAATGDSLMIRAITAAKRAAPDMAVMTETCLCSYTADRNCFIPDECGDLDYAGTLGLLAAQAVRQADAGADIVGPASMIDGAVAVVRTALDNAGHRSVGIRPHVIFTSRLYDRYRAAMNAAPARGNRGALQIDPSRPEQAIALSLRFLADGADMILLEPALHTLDVLVELRKLTAAPLAPFSVSGEYAQLTQDGRLNLAECADAMMERLTVYRRAGGDTIITYFAKQAARILTGHPPVRLVATPSQGFDGSAQASA
jgi:porphobilinogen synthase